MSKHEWSELDYVAGAAHAMHMSYGSFVAAGMPNLKEFKQAVERGEIITIRKGGRGCGVTAALKSMKLPLKPKVDKRGQRKKLVCEGCKTLFAAEIKAGPLPRFCPECKASRLRTQKSEGQKRYRDRKKAGEPFA